MEGARDAKPDSTENPPAASQDKNIDDAKTDANKIQSLLEGPQGKN
jgi:hypothetical protein